MYSTAIFYVFFLVTVVLEIVYVLDKKRTLNSRKKNNINIILTITLILIAALRSPYTGMDTVGYYYVYGNLLRNTKDWHFFFDELIDAIRGGTFKDTIMWSFVSKILTFILPSAQLWMGAISAVFIVSAYTVIRRYSKDPIVSWLYLCVFIYAFILQGLRQSVAMAIVLLSFKYVYERKPAKFLLLIAFAYLFHQSSIAFIIAYPLYGLNVKRKHIIIIIIALVLSRVVPHIINSVLEYLTSKTRFSGYIGRSGMYSLSGSIILTCIFIFCYRYKDRLCEDNDVNRLLFALSFVGVITQTMAVIVAEMFRVSYYFSMFNMLLVANTFEIMDEKSRTRNLLSRIMLMYIFIMYYYLSGGFLYKFYWQ